MRKNLPNLEKWRIFKIIYWILLLWIFIQWKDFKKRVGISKILSIILCTQFFVDPGNSKLFLQFKINENMHVIMSSKLFGGLFKKIFRLEAFKYLKKFPNSLEIIFLCIYLKINLILKWAKIREKGSQILFINQKSLVGPKEQKRCQEESLIFLALYLD